MTSCEAIEIAAQLWCLPQHAHKEMDVEFAESIATALRAYAEEAVARYAYTVDDPWAAHLHYDACPFKPYAEDVERPESAPKCTCAETHKGAYWKGQFMLERGQRKLDVDNARQEGWNAGVEAMWAAAVEELKLQSCRCGQRIRALPGPAMQNRREGRDESI